MFGVHANGRSFFAPKWLIVLTLTCAAGVATTFWFATAASATDANFCALYWTKFDTRCGYRDNPAWGSFLRGINYTRNYDMWVFATAPDGSGQDSAHAGPNTYKACITYSPNQHRLDWSVMPFYPTNATIAGHVDNYEINEAC